MKAAADVVTGLAACRKAVQLYPPTHPAHAEAIASLIAAVGGATESGSFVLNVHEGRLYHESLVLPADVHGVATVVGAFEDRHIESLTFSPGFNQLDALGLTEVLTLRPSPELDVVAELSSREVSAVSVSVAIPQEDEREEHDRQREADRAMYQRLLAALRPLRTEFAQGGVGDLTAATRLVASVIERHAVDPAAVLGLTAMRGVGDHDLFHSLNVMIYTVTMGRALGLSDEALASLGLSALLHDVGKAAFDSADPAQAEPMRMMHPKVGAQILQHLALEDPAPLLVAYEHHMHFDGTGYPERESGRAMHEYSRMVAVANRYENLTNPRDAVSPLTPDKAIIQVLREANTVFDPFFARLFASAMGAFPVGCLVRLTDHSVGVVVRPGAEPLAPVVRVVYDTDGVELEDPFELDLSHSDARIAEVIEPEVLRLEIAEKL